MQYDVIIGLEVHAELNTKTKCFCACKNEYSNEPNTHICSGCSGFPGTFPVLNKQAVEKTIRAGLALGFDINRTAIFERKHYFYPDLSTAYQLSQLEKPICINGHLQVGEKNFPINRIHLEEDAGKLVHIGADTLVDYNRAGTPLIELVTDALKEPHMETADEAVEFLTKLRQIYIYSGVADCDIEKGQLRCDVNISLKPKGSTKYGTRVEMKNIMGFKSLHRAITYEIARQKEILDDGGEVLQQTRKWDNEKGENFALRTKENSDDYRYLPDPNLLKVNISEEIIQKVKDTMPPLPHELKKKYMEEYGLNEYDTDVILANKEVSDFYKECLDTYFQPKSVANWFTTEILARIKVEDKIQVSKENLIWIIKSVDENKLRRLPAKELLSNIWGTDLNAEEEAKKMGIIVDISSDFVFEILDRIITERADVVEQYKREQDPKILNFLVGQVMKETKGKANASEVMEKLREKIK